MVLAVSLSGSPVPSLHDSCVWRAETRPYITYITLYSLPSFLPSSPHLASDPSLVLLLDAILALESADMSSSFRCPCSSVTALGVGVPSLETTPSFSSGTRHMDKWGHLLRSTLSNSTLTRSILPRSTRELQLRGATHQKTMLKGGIQG